MIAEEDSGIREKIEEMLWLQKKAGPEGAEVELGFLFPSLMFIK